MPIQFNHFRNVGKACIKYRLFLAIFPDPQTANRIYEIGARMRSTHGLEGELIPVEHFHVTIHYLGYHVDVSDRLVQLTNSLCEQVGTDVAPFKVKFDRVLSFSGAKRNHPLVLIDKDDGNIELVKFRKLLSKELNRVRIPFLEYPGFIPHVTLLYDPRSIAEEPIDSVSWMANEVELVKSVIGEAKYERLGRWKLVV